MNLTDEDIEDMIRALDEAEPGHLGFIPATGVLGEVELQQLADASLEELRECLLPKTEGDPNVAEETPLPTQPPLPRAIPEYQKSLLCACIILDDVEQVAGDVIAEAIKLAESDPTFRQACESIGGRGDGPLGRLQHACRSISARIAADEALNPIASRIQGRFRKR